MKLSDGVRISRNVVDNIVPRAYRMFHRTRGSPYL